MRPIRSVLWSTFAVSIVVAALAGCSAGPEAKPSASPSPSHSASPTLSPSESATPTPDIAPAQWLETAISKTQDAGTFSVLTQEWSDSGALENLCTERHINYATGAFMTLGFEYPGPQLTISGTTCTPAAATARSASVGERYYPDLSAAASTRRVITASPQTQRQFWDEKELPWQCYRDLLSNASTTTGTARSWSATVPADAFSQSCLDHYYVGSLWKGDTSWTFETDDTGRLSTVSGTVPETVDDGDSADFDFDAQAFATTHQDVFSGYGQSRELAPLNGMSLTDLAALPVTATANTVEEMVAASHGG